MTDLHRILKLSGLELPDILEEGAKDRYREMFQMFDPKGGNDALRIWQDSAENAVEWARRTLKRSDRIVWYLRLVRIGLLQSAIERLAHDERQHTLVEFLNKVLAKTTGDLAKASGESAGEVAAMAKTTRDNRAFKQNLTHFMSMVGQVPELNAYKFATQTPSQIVKDLKQIEDDYNDAADDSHKALPPTEDRYTHAEKLIDFGDGFIWWNLAVQYCDAEGKAMGHCGNNSHMKKNGDCLLSLRKRSTVGDRVIDVPYLTFILDAKNRLGEMKGRGNAKPAQRYHKYITALLLNPIVEGVKGGGYLPENNFKLSDLPEEDQEKILEQKPELERAKTMDFNEKLDELREQGVGIDGDIEDDRVVVWKGGWNDLDHSSFHQALEAIHDGLEVRLEPMRLSDMTELLSSLDNNEVAKLAELGSFSVPPGTVTRADRYNLAAEFINSTEISAFIQTAISADLSEISPSDLNKFGHMFLHRATELNSSEYLYPDLEVPDDIFEGEYKITISMHDFDALHAGIDNDDENDNETADYQYFNGRDGWFNNGYHNSLSDIIDGNNNLDTDEQKIFDRIFPLVQAFEDGKKGRNEVNIGVNPSDLSAEEIADAVKDALEHSEPAYRPGPDQMGDLFGDDFPKHV